MKRLLFLLLLSPIILLAQGVTSVSTGYYVGSGGHDTDTGKSWATRWETLNNVNTYLGSEAGYDTVLVANGTYTDQLNLAYSGSSTSAPLVVMNYGTNRPTIDVEGDYATAGWYATSGDSNQVLQGFYIRSDAFIHWDGARRLTIKNCYAWHPFTSEIYEQGKIVDTKWSVVDQCTTSTSTGGASGTYWTPDPPVGGEEKNGISINGSSDHILVQNSVLMGLITHYSMTTYGGSGVHHIIYRNIDVWRHHGGSDADAGGGGTTYMLFDNIRFRKLYSSWQSQNGKGFHWQSIGGQGSIFRYNQIIKDTMGYNVNRGIISAGVGDSLKTLKNLAFYNNSFIGTWHYSDGYGDRGILLFFEQYRAYWNGWPYMEKLWFKNNIFCRSNSQLMFYNDKGATSENIDEHDVVFDHNLWYDTGDYGKVEVITGDGGSGLVSIATAEATWPNMFMNNLTSAPLFEDSTVMNLTLNATSPAINAGTHLTVTTTTEEGSLGLDVENAAYFCDGWGMVEGDSIKIGSEDPVGITSISGNVITLEEARSWTTGDPVYYYRYDRFKGSAPDIGAVEYEASGDDDVNLYHVGPGGDDDWDGQEYATRWVSIYKANNTLTAGKTVKIYGGTYTDPISPTNSGTAGNPITYKAVAGTHPIIDGQTYGIDLSDGQDYITVTADATGVGGGFGFTNCDRIFYSSTGSSSWTGTGASHISILHLDTDMSDCNQFTVMHFQDMSFVEIGYNKITHADTNGVYAGSLRAETARFYAVKSLYSHHNEFPPAYHAAMTDTWNCDTVIQEYDRGWDLGHGYFGAEGLTSNSLYQYNFARNGMIWPTPAGGNGGCTMQFECWTTIIRNNVIVQDTIDNDGTSYGMAQLSNYSDYGQHTEFNAVYNNTFWARFRLGSNKYVFNMTNDVTDHARRETDNNIFNNVFVLGGDGTSAAIIGLTVASPLTEKRGFFKGNCLYRPYGNANKEIYTSENGYMSLDDYSSSYPLVFDPSNFVANPLFLDTTKTGGYEFAIDSTSPLYNAAVPLAQVQSNSSGSTIEVDYPWNFWMGSYFKPLGDSIIVGTDIVRVTARDISGRTITVNRSIDVVDGDEIYLYSGNKIMNDIGAYQYVIGGEEPPEPPINLIYLPWLKPN